MFSAQILFPRTSGISLSIIEPDGAPQNVIKGHNSSSASILFTWDKVPVGQQNGIITGYTITYQSQTGNHNGSVPAGSFDRQKNITDLKECLL